MTRLTHNLALLLALVPQLLLGALAPALVVCQEGDGGRVLELSVSGCCLSEGATPTQAEAVRAQDEECGGCQDAVLAVTLQRDEGQGLADLSPTVAFQVPGLSWDASSRTARAPPQVDPASNGTLTALRTVNLRC